MRVGGRLIVVAFFILARVLRNLYPVILLVVLRFVVREFLPLALRSCIFGVRLSGISPGIV